MMLARFEAKPRYPENMSISLSYLGIKGLFIEAAVTQDTSSRFNASINNNSDNRSYTTSAGSNTATGTASTSTTTSSTSAA